MVALVVVELVLPIMGIFAGPGGWEPGRALKPAVRLSEPGARALESAERAERDGFKSSWKSLRNPKR